MESGQNLGSGLVAVKLDVVTDPVGGKEAIDAAGLQKFPACNFIEQLLRVGEEFASLLAVSFVVENGRVTAAQLPGVEEGRPVDERNEVGEREG